MASIGFKVTPTNVPTKESQDTSWINWYKGLKSSFGKKTANYLFMLAWEKRGTWTANTSELRELLDKNGVKLSTDTITSIGAGIAGGVEGIGDFIEGVFTAGKWTVIAIIIIIVGGAGMLIFNIAKEPIKAIATAGKAVGDAKSIKIK